MVVAVLGAVVVAAVEVVVAVVVGAAVEVVVAVVVGAAVDVGVAELEPLPQAKARSITARYMAITLMV